MLPTFASAANRFWVGGVATWDGATTANWSATSGGAPGASVPTSSDAVTSDQIGSAITMSAASAAASIDIETGSFDTASNNFSVAFFLAAPGTSVTLGTSTVTLTGGSGAWAADSSTTLSAAASTLLFTGAAARFLTFGGKAYHIITFTGGGAAALVATFSGDTIDSLTVTGTAVKTDTWRSAGNLTVGTLTLNGNSTVNRLLVGSATLGTPLAIAATAVSASNLSVQDVTISPAVNLSAIAGLSGDCGGNSGITFTSAQPNFWVGDTGSWSDAANHWASGTGGAAGTGRTPLCQDTSTFDAASFTTTGKTVTADMPRLGGSIDFSAVGTDNPALSITVSATVFGSLTLHGGMTSANNGALTLTFQGRGASTLTSAGVSISPNLTISMPGGALTMQDSLNLARGLTVTDGTFNANNLNLSVATFTSTGTATRAIVMGAGTWTVTSTGTVWSVATTGLTLTAGSSIVSLSNTSSTSKTFAGGGATYNRLTIPSAGTGTINVSGSNTFATFTSGAPKTLSFTAGTTQAFTTLTLSSSAGNVITIQSSSAGTQAKLSISGGKLTYDYLSLKDSQATGGAIWYAGSHSTNVSGNSGWRFSGAPGSVSVKMRGKSSICQLSCGGVISQ